MLLAAAIFHQGFALILVVLSGNTAPTAMLARAMLESSKRFIDVLQNGKSPLVASLLQEKDQLVKLRKFQNGNAQTVDPTSDINAIDALLATLDIDVAEPREGELKHLLGSEAEEYWKLLSRDVHGRPSMLLRQFAPAIADGRIDSVLERDQENLDAHFDIASYALEKMAACYIDSEWVPEQSEKQRLHALLAAIKAQSKAAA